MPETNDFREWYYGVPKLTRWWFTASVVIPLAARFGILSPMSLILTSDFIGKFHLWRPLTALFFYPISPQTGFAYLINLYFLYSYSSKLETSTFEGKPADYMFMLLFNWTVLIILGLLGEIVMLMDPMILSVMYIWCQLNRDAIVQFWFGTQFKAIYLPWVLCAFNMIVRGSVFLELVGIAVGHLYFFLMFKYPQDYNGIEILKTPEILYKYFPNSANNVHGFFGRVPDNQQQRPAAAPRQNYGRGYRLGDQ